MADLRTLIETKILSKSDRGLEKIGADGNGNGKGMQHTVRMIFLILNSINLYINFSQDIHRSLDTGDEQLSNSTATLIRESQSNLVKGKSMPSLRFVYENNFLISLFHFYAFVYLSYLITHYLFAQLST
jgi:hypothetical protein